MRSQKQVRRAVKVRSLKNTAAGKWKTYRKCLEDRKAWQNNAILTRHQYSSNTLAPPPPRHRRIKEPKQRSPEELAERQRLREQRRLEKKLAKQRASTSTVPEIKKEKKLKEISNIDSAKNVSAERKTTTKTTTVKNSMIKEAAKTKRLMNEQTQNMVNMANQKVTGKKLNKLKTMKVPKLQNEFESKHEYLKDERLPVSVDEQKMNHSLSPMKIERNELMQSKKETIGINKGGKKSSEEKKERIKEIDKKAKNNKMQSSIPAQMIESQKPVAPTILNSIENEDEQIQIHASPKKVEAVISKEQKTKKRNRQSNTNTFRAENDFVKDDRREKGNEVANVDVAKIVVGRGEKKKDGNHHDELQSKSMECNNKTKKQQDDIGEKTEKKELDEVVAHHVQNQNSALENTEFKIEKIVDHIVLSDDKIAKDSETLSKTEMKMKTFIPEELEMKTAKLTEKHPEALDATNLNLSDNIIGDVSVASFAKEAKHEVNVEKIERNAQAKHEVNVEKLERNAQVLQRDRVNRVPVARERIYKLLPRDIQFCVHMIEEYGENYEAMTKDEGNIFRDSAKGIARRIRIFKESPQYEAYLKQKIEKNGSVA